MSKDSANFSMSVGFLASLNYAVMLMTGIGATIGGTALNQIIRDLGISHSIAGNFMTFQTLGVAATSLMGGLFCDNFGRKATLVAGTIAMGLSLFLFAYIKSWLLGLALFTLFGVGRAVSGVANHATLSDLYGTDSIRAINLLHVFYGIGSFVGPWMISLLLGLGVSWKIGFVISGFLTFMLSVPGYLLRYPASSPMNAAKKGHFSLFSDFRALTFSFVLGLHIGQNLGVTTWLSTFFINKMGTGPAFAATALGLYGLGVTLGRVLNVYVKGTDPYKMLQIAFAGSLLALVIGNYAPWKTLAVGAFLAAGFVSSWIYPTTLGFCNSLYPRSAGTVSGMLMGSSRGIGMLIPWLMGIIADKSSILKAMTLLPLLSLIPLVMLFLMSNRLFATATITNEAFDHSKL